MSKNKKLSEEKNKENDVFDADWQEAKTFWTKIHRKYDYSYLFYRSILTYNDLYGQDYLKAFGLQVFVPRTFQTIEALDSQVNVRSIEFKIEGEGMRNEKKAEVLQRFDNAEWRRSKADLQAKEGVKNAMIFGNGYLYNYFENDEREFHFPKEVEEKGDAQDLVELGGMTWEKQSVIRYKGMRIKSLNPYYVFPDPNATSDDDWEYCYVYTPMRTEKLREFVVSSGWMSEKEAEEKICNSQIEHFDKIRETIDSMYQMPITPFTRGDHQKVDNRATNPVEGQTKELRDMSAIIERYEEDYYEVRIAGSDEVLYSSYNPYPHKRIPINPVWDYKVPNEFPGMGEPEIIRWQQVEENRVHNMFLDGVMMSMVQRYGINESVVKDPTDLSFNNPFRPIRLKQGLNAKVTDAIMPLPQPDVKKTPLELMALIKDLVQGTTGATDFIVSASDSKTDTATESNNLAAATGSRTRAKARNIDERTIEKVVEQWHACYYYFYDEAMDIHITGERWYVKFLPYTRDRNEDKKLIKEAIIEAQDLSDNGATGNTVEEVYKNAGYDDVLFRDDLLGKFRVKVKITDLNLERDSQIKEGMQAIELMGVINKTTPPDAEKYDVMKFSKDVFSNFKYIDNIDDYTTGGNSGIMNVEEGVSPQQQQQVVPELPVDAQNINPITQ